LAISLMSAFSAERGVAAPLDRSRAGAVWRVFAANSTCIADPQTENPAPDQPTQV